MLASCPGSKLLCTVLKQRKRKKILPSCAHALEKTRLKFDHFTLFCTRRQRNVPNCETHAQSDCLCSLKGCCFVAFLLPLPSSLLKLLNVFGSVSRHAILCMAACNLSWKGWVNRGHKHEHRTPIFGVKWGRFEHNRGRTQESLQIVSAVSVIRLRSCFFQSQKHFANESFLVLLF